MEKLREQVDSLTKDLGFHAQINKEYREKLNKLEEPRFTEKLIYETPLVQKLIENLNLKIDECLEKDRRLASLSNSNESIKNEVVKRGENEKRLQL